MKNRSKDAILIASTLLLSTLIATAPTFMQPKVEADGAMTNVQLKALYEEKCSACHDAYDPTDKGYTPVQWQATVNRMMNAHNARASITDVQAAQIVTYLSEFAPRPGQNGGDTGIGIWQTDPRQTASYPFTYGPNLNSFDINGGAWRVVPAPDIYSGFLKEFTAGNTTDVIVDHTNSYQGALDARCQFQVIKGSLSATVGLVFGETDPKNYLAVDYTPSTGALNFIKVSDGSSTVLQQAIVVKPQLASTDNWHDLRVKVSEGGAKVEFWLDYQKQLSSTYPQWQGGKVGILSIGPITAGYRQLTIDTYQNADVSPAGDVLMH